MGLGFARFLAGKMGLDALGLGFLPTENGNQNIEFDWDLSLSYLKGHNKSLE